MRHYFALFIVLALLTGACGGAGTGSAPAPTPLVAGRETEAVPTLTVAPTVAPTPTTAPTATPRPTPKLPMLVEVTSDADWEENFVCKKPTEIAKSIESMTYENFKWPLPFNGQAKKFTISVHSVAYPDGRVATIFVIKLLGETEATVVSYLPTRIGLGRATYGSETLFKMIPFDETKPTQAAGYLFFNPGGRGVYVEVTGSAEPLVTVDEFLTPRHREVGKATLHITAGAKPISAWPGNGHIVIRGSDFDPKTNASPITKDSRLMEGNKQVAICAS